jgi:hypothetical protein
MLFTKAPFDAFHLLRAGGDRRRKALIWGRGVVTMKAMFFTTELTENTEEKLEFGGRAVSVKTAKVNLPQRSHLKAASQGFTG